MSLDLDNTPVIVATTFPARKPLSKAAAEFSAFASRTGWHRIDTSKWIVFLSNVFDSGTDTSTSKPRKILIFDDRVISGETQRTVAELLVSRGFEVKRAAMLATAALAKELHYVGSSREGDFYLPWGPKRGRY